MLIRPVTIACLLAALAGAGCEQGEGGAAAPAVPGNGAASAARTAAPPAQSPPASEEMMTVPSPVPVDGRNRLGDETSPYLLQHKTNPVHWWPWGPEAFAAAREANKPIFLSIGYSTCYWRRPRS
jgi:hypothetical protein